MARQLSENKKEWIIEDYKAGMTVAEISKSEGIVEPTIRKIIEEFKAIHPDETPAERLGKSPKKKRGKKAKAEKNEKKAKKPAPVEPIAGLSYGEQKAAALDPAYIPQRMAPAATSSNPFLGKRGHIDGVNTPPKPDEKPKTFVFGYSKEIEAINRELKQKEAADTGELKESEPIPEGHAEVPADTEATMENPNIVEEPEAERDPYDDDRRPEKWERLYYAGTIIDAILKGKSVLVANLKSRSKKTPVGVYDADDLEVWQLKELLNNEDSLFFIAKA